MKGEGEAKYWTLHESLTEGFNKSNEHRLFNEFVLKLLQYGDERAHQHITVEEIKAVQFIYEDHEDQTYGKLLRSKWYRVIPKALRGRKEETELESLSSLMPNKALSFKDIFSFASAVASEDNPEHQLIIGFFKIMSELEGAINLEDMQLDNSALKAIINIGSAKKDSLGQLIDKQLYNQFPEFLKIAITNCAVTLAASKAETFTSTQGRSLLSLCEGGDVLFGSTAKILNIPDKGSPSLFSCDIVDNERDYNQKKEPKDVSSQFNTNELKGYFGVLLTLGGHLDFKAEKNVLMVSIEYSSSNVLSSEVNVINQLVTKIHALLMRFHDKSFTSILATSKNQSKTQFDFKLSCHEIKKLSKDLVQVKESLKTVGFKETEENYITHGMN